MRRSAHALAAVAASIWLAASAATPAPTLLRDQVWTPPGPAQAYALSHAPQECLARADAQIEIGRALFRSPGVLGGPAARAGLSCNACHSNGRVNRNFLLPELTDRAGAADVTSEWASDVRGDGMFNPRDIPDLAGAAQRPSFGQAREPSLRQFVAGVIEEEFQGAPLPSPALDALIAYIAALTPTCALTDVPLTLSDAANDVRRAIAGAREADAATASLLLYAARDALGHIVERLPAEAFAAERRALEALARDLGAIQAQPELLLAADAPAWSARFDALIGRIAPREAYTYFNEATLARALED